VNATIGQRRPRVDERGVHVLGLNGATIPSANLETGVRVAHEAGFGGYEPRVPALLDAERRYGGARSFDSLGASGLSWLPLNALEGVFELDQEALIARARETFGLAARFSIAQVIAVPGRPARAVPLETARETLSRLVDLARAYEVHVLYELIGFPSHAFPSLRAAVALTADLDVPLVLDTFHLAVSRTDPSELRTLDPERVGLVHLSDALVPGPVAGLRDADRVLPGEGALPIIELLRGILACGYAGAVSVEVFHPRYGAADAEDVARQAHRSAEAALAAAWSVRREEAG